MFFYIICNLINVKRLIDLSFNEKENKFFVEHMYYHFTPILVLRIGFMLIVGGKRAFNKGLYLESYHELDFIRVVYTKFFPMGIKY